MIVASRYTIVTSPKGQYTPQTIVRICSVSSYKKYLCPNITYTRQQTVFIVVATKRISSATYFTCFTNTPIIENMDGLSTTRNRPNVRQRAIFANFDAYTLAKKEKYNRRSNINVRSLLNSYESMNSSYHGYIYYTFYLNI